MANTNSWAFPNLFDVSRNRISIYEDSRSVVNRSRLLFLTEQGELYNEPTFGVGLKQHLFKYNTENEKAIIQQKIISQLEMFEPCVIPQDTQFADGLLFTDNGASLTDGQNFNKLEFTTALVTRFGTRADVNITQQ